MYDNPMGPNAAKPALLKSFPSQLIAIPFFSCSDYTLELSVAAQEEIRLDPLSKHIQNLTISPLDLLPPSWSNSQSSLPWNIAIVW